MQMSEVPKQQGEEEEGGRMGGRTMERVCPQRSTVAGGSRVCGNGDGCPQVLYRSLCAPPEVRVEACEKRAGPLDIRHPAERLPAMQLVSSYSPRRRPSHSITYIPPHTCLTDHAAIPPQHSLSAHSATRPSLTTSRAQPHYVLGSLPFHRDLQAQTHTQTPTHHPITHIAFPLDLPWPLF